jgi:NTE family protein
LLHGRGGGWHLCRWQTRQYRNWIESLDYLDVLRLVDVSFRLGAIRGEKVFGQIRKIVGEINIEELRIPYTAVAADLTNQQEIWFQEGCLHQAMRASAAIPSLFTPVMQGNRMLVDGGILNPLPIVPVVSSHCDLIIAVNLNATNQRHYQLPVIQRPPRFKSALRQPDQFPGFEDAVPAQAGRTIAAAGTGSVAAEAAEINPWLESANPKPSNRQPRRSAMAHRSPPPARSSSTTSGRRHCWT